MTLSKQKTSLSINSIVKCVNDVFTKEQKNSIISVPKSGEYYIVRDIEHYPESSTTAIRLKEIKNPIAVPPAADFIEPSFNINRFEVVSLPKIIKDEFGIL